MEITLDGPHTIITVNGAKVTDYTEGDPVPERKFDFEPLRAHDLPSVILACKITATTT